MSFWNHYEGRAIGKIINFLYHYCGLNIAENCTIGNHEIKYRGNLVATVSWEEFEYDGKKIDIPIFNFCDKYYMEQQDSKKVIAAIDMKEFRDQFENRADYYELARSVYGSNRIHKE